MPPVMQNSGVLDLLVAVAGQESAELGSREVVLYRADTNHIRVGQDTNDRGEHMGPM